MAESQARYFYKNIIIEPRQESFMKFHQRPEIEPFKTKKEDH